MRYQDDWPTQNGGTPRVMTTPFSTRTVRVLVEKCYTKHTAGPNCGECCPLTRGGRAAKAMQDGGWVSRIVQMSDIA